MKKMTFQDFLNNNKEIANDMQMGYNNINVLKERLLDIENDGFTESNCDFQIDNIRELINDTINFLDMYQLCIIEPKRDKNNTLLSIWEKRNIFNYEIQYINQYQIIDIQQGKFMSEGRIFNHFCDCIEFLRSFHSVDVKGIENYSPNEILEFGWDIVNYINEDSVLDIYMIDTQYGIDVEKYRIEKLFNDGIISEKDYNYLLKYLK